MPLGCSLWLNRKFQFGHHAQFEAMAVGLNLHMATIHPLSARSSLILAKGRREESCEPLIPVPNGHPKVLQQRHARPYRTGQDSNNDSGTGAPRHGTRKFGWPTPIVLSIFVLDSGPRATQIGFPIRPMIERGSKHSRRSPIVILRRG